MEDNSRSMMFRLAAVVLFVATLSQAQTCGQWADGNAFAAHGGKIFDSVMFDDGTGPALYVAGNFDGVGNSGTNAIAKWNGSEFVPVGGDVPGSGAALTVYDDPSAGHELVLTGLFATAGATSVHNIAAWNGNAWSALGSGLSSNGSALAVYNDGSGQGLYVGGYFVQAGGATANHLALWRDGVWSQVGGGIAGNATVTVAINTLAVFNGGLYVGGQFTTVGSLSTNGIAKWQNGAWSAVGTLGTNGLSYPVVQHLLPVNLPTTGGLALVASGVFSVGSAYEIASWNGAAWSPMGVTSTSNYSNPNGLGLYDPGTGPVLLASGHFNTPSALISWNGTSWDVFAQAQGDFFAGINTMTQTGVGSLFVGGSVTQISGTLVPYAATLSQGSVTPMGTFGHGFDGGVYSLQNLDAGDGTYLYAAGAFRVVDGHACVGIARRVNGTWVPLATTMTNTSGPTGPTVRCMLLFNDGSGPAIYIGGSFATVDGVVAPNIARWRPGSGWQAVGPGLNSFPTTGVVGGGVYALAVQDDNGAAAPGPQLIAAGDFSYAGTQGGFAHVARWTGSAWSTVGSGLSGPGVPLTLASFDEDGAGPGNAALWVGGTFGLLKRWDGGSWTQPANNPGANSVSALFVSDVGGVHAMYAGGDFFSPGATSVLRYAAGTWTPVGQSLIAHGILGADANPGAECFAVMDDGAGQHLVAGGAFYDGAATGTSNIAVLYGQHWTNIEGGVGGAVPSYLNTVRSVAIGGDGTLWAGGTFGRYYVSGTDTAGVPSTNIASVLVCRHCTSDFDGDGDSGTDADIEAFFACLAGNCCAACASPDFNADGDTGTDSDIESFFRVLAGGNC